MKTFWKVLYNIVLAVTHICGVYFAAAACLVRGKFIYRWTAQEDILMWLLLASVFGMHYLLIFWGHKRNVVYSLTNKILQIYERIVGVILLSLLLYGNIFTLESINALWPVIVFGAAMLTLRHLWIKKTKTGTKDGSPS